jgi:hypothetical protein
MKGRLFSATMLVLVLVLMLAVPASAGKPTPWDWSVTWDDPPTEPGSTYSPSHSVTLAGYRNVRLIYTIVWYDSDGHADSQDISVAIKTPELQTLELPSAGSLTFTVGECDLTGTQMISMEQIAVFNKKGSALSQERRYLGCRLNQTP